MNEAPESSPAAPKAPILLATDLSARSDRALDRAVDLAGEWGTGLVALHVLDPAASPDRLRAWADDKEDGEAYAARIAHLQLIRDLRGAAVESRIVISRAQDAVGAIVDGAEQLDARIIVTGVARSEALGRFLLGTTVEHLARRITRPLLVVRERPRHRYSRIVLATDFSPESAFALSAAVQLFPGREITVYHAASPPTGMDAANEDLAHLRDAPARRSADALIASANLPQGTVTRVVIEHGRVEATLSRYVRDEDRDLVVIGTRTAPLLERLLAGGSASELLRWVPCDMLVVRQPEE